jgi:hypothetical protein
MLSLRALGEAAPAAWRVIRVLAAVCSAAVLIAGGVGAGSLTASALCWINSPTDVWAASILVLATAAVAGCGWLLLDLSLWLDFEAHLNARPRLDLSHLCVLPQSRHR